MTSLLPIIEELADAQDHAARAQWLLAAPLSVLLRDQVDIRRLLTAVSSHEGLAYFDAEIAALSAVRGRDGLAPESIRMTREYARIGIQVISTRSTLPPSSALARTRSAARCKRRGICKGV